MNLSCLLGTSPEETDFTWPWLSSGKCSSFAVFIFGFPSVLLGLQLILSFWVASWAAGTKSSSKQFAWSFPEDLGCARSLGELDPGPPGPCVHPAFDGERGICGCSLPGEGGGEATWHSPIRRTGNLEFALPWESRYVAAGSWHVGKGPTACGCVRELVASWHGACCVGVRAGLAPHPGVPGMFLLL